MSIKWGTLKTADDLKAERYEQAAQQVRSKRDKLFVGLQKRVARYHSQVRLGVTPTDAREDLDNEAQALRDITEQEGFPYDVQWPELNY